MKDQDSFKDINKYLTIAIGGQWYDHKVKHLGSAKYECSCGGSWDSYALESPDHHIEVPIDFDEWEGFGKLWEWAIKQKWWPKFYGVKLHEKDGYDGVQLNDTLINPEVFAITVYEFLNTK